MTTPSRPAPPPPPVRKGQVQAYEAMASYQAQQERELSFDEGDLLFILDRSDSGWWLASLDNKKGYVPSKHVSSDGVRSAIIEGAARGNLALVEECLRAGVSVNSLDKSGCSALHAASRAGHTHIITHLLLHHSLELNLQNKLGDTPLHCASYRGHAETVQMLLHHGARTNILNKDSCTARQLAKSGIIISLLEAGKVRQNRISFGYEDTEYGAAASEDSDN